MCILLRAPQYSTFACCLTPVLTLVVLLVMLHDIDDISFSKRRYFLIVSWMSISVYCIPTQDTHITRDKCMGIHISRGYTYHCDTGNLGIIFTGDTQYPPCESGELQSHICCHGITLFSGFQRLVPRVFLFWIKRRPWGRDLELVLWKFVVGKILIVILR